MTPRLRCQHLQRSVNMCNNRVACTTHYCAAASWSRPAVTHIKTQIGPRQSPIAPDSSKNAGTKDGRAPLVILRITRTPAADKENVVVVTFRRKLKTPDQVEKSRNKELRDLFQAGVGCHHAGMLRSDRGLTERAFEDGAIKVRQVYESHEVLSELCVCEPSSA